MLTGCFVIDQRFQISGAILTFFLLIMRHPDVQKRAYEEISSVVGTDRLPELADRPSLRYLDCVIQEAFRFNPPIPLVTHSNSKEDEYEGCRIPKKTWLMGNIWYVQSSSYTCPRLSLRGLGRCCITKTSTKTARVSFQSASFPERATSLRGILER